MQSADYWRLCDDLSIFQAIMLILDYDPSQQDSNYVENHKRILLPEGYSALKTALCNAVRSKKIETEIHFFYNEYEQSYSTTDIDIDKTTISVEQIRKFLREKGIFEGFFFPLGGVSESYLDTQNSFFAPKLSAAVHAWKAISENWSDNIGKTPKQAIEKWLRENASAYGLTKDDGTPNENAISEISKVANWKPEGGAAKTPIGGIVSSNPPPHIKTPRKLKVFDNKTQQELLRSMSLEEDIPF